MTLMYVEMLKGSCFCFSTIGSLRVGAHTGEIHKGHASQQAHGRPKDGRLTATNRVSARSKAEHLGPNRFNIVLCQFCYKPLDGKTALGGRWNLCMTTLHLRVVSAPRCWRSLPAAYCSRTPLNAPKKVSIVPACPESKFPKVSTCQYRGSDQSRDASNSTLMPFWPASEEEVRRWGQSNLQWHQEECRSLCRNWPQMIQVHTGTALPCRILSQRAARAGCSKKIFALDVVQRCTRVPRQRSHQKSTDGDRRATSRTCEQLFRSRFSRAITGFQLCFLCGSTHSDPVFQRQPVQQ